MDKDKLIEEAKSLAAAMFDPLGNGESDNMVMSNQDAQNAAEIIYGLVALLEDDNPPWTAKDFATAVPFQDIVKMHLAEQAEQKPVYAFRRKGQDSFCTCDKERYEELADKPWMFEVTTFYAAPVRTKDLTDDDKAEIECALNMAFDLLCKPVDSIAEMYCFGMGDCDEVRQQLKEARAVIAADREKNK